MIGLDLFTRPVLAWAPGPWELAIIAFIALLLFGSRLPSVARSLGKGITEFKKGLKDDDEALPPATRGPEGTNAGAGAGPDEQKEQG